MRQEVYAWVEIIHTDERQEIDEPQVNVRLGDATIYEVAPYEISLFFSLTNPIHQSIIIKIININTS